MTEIVVLSDIHVGSKFAVSPLRAAISQPPIGDSLDTEYEPNRVQRALYDFWGQVAKEWKRPDILVINGEPIDGPNKHNPSEVWSTNIFDQMNAAKTLIDMYDAKKKYVVRGSDYHVTVEDQPFEEYFGRHIIGASPVGSRYAPYELNLDVNGKVVNFMHAIGNTAVWQYRSTPITRELAMIKLNRSHRYDASVIIRSHVHYYWVTASTSHIAIITPCWKLQDWFVYRKGAGSSAWDIGAVRLRIEKDGTIDWDAKILKSEILKPPLVKETAEK